MRVLSLLNLEKMTFYPSMNSRDIPKFILPLDNNETLNQIKETLGFGNVDYIQ